MAKAMRRITVIALAGMLAAAAAHAGGKSKRDDPSQIGSRDVGKGINLYSYEKEMALGRQLAQEVQRQARIAADPIVAEYVNRVGQNVVRNSDAKVPFTFTVIDDETVNAFALPGGYVFVNTGLIKMADDEAEFAGALAHEIAHVAARHMTRQATRSQLAQIASVPIGILLGGIPGYLAREGTRLAIPMAFLHFERRDEAEADYLGVQYMYAAGYDPAAMITIFEKLDAMRRRNPGLLARVFATHPMDAGRIRNVEKEIDEILPPKAEYVVTTSAYREIRQRLMPPGGPGNQRDAQPRLRVAAADPDAPPTIRRRDLAE